MTRVLANQLVEALEKQNVDCNSEETMDFEYEKYDFRESTTQTGLSSATTKTSMVMKDTSPPTTPLVQ